MKKFIHKVNKLSNKKKKIAKNVILKKTTRIKVKAKPKIIAKNKIKMKLKTVTTTKTKNKSKMTKTVPQTQAPSVTNKVVTTIQAKSTITPSMGATAFGPINVKPYKTEQNEEYMNDKQLAHFRAVLLKWKSQLMAEVDRTMHHMQEEVSNYPDPVDRASQEEEFSLELRARDRERKLLRKIDETLSRINDNDYGYCDDCGAEIGVRRLEARPTATQCIECKTIAEIREKQVGDGG